MANLKKNTGKTNFELKNLPTPKEIYAYLDQYVIGQEEAKKVLSVAVYNHYKKTINSFNNKRNVEIDKSNLILLGPTGCGKTLLVKTIAKLIGVPCYIQDCTKLTASGYVGSDVEECLVGLLRSCDYDIEAAKYGIVMLDEGDKIAKKGAGPSITRDVSGECVQQSLLKIVEGDIVGVPPAGGRKHPEQQLIYIDTTNILFIMSGAFVGLDEIVKRRMGSGKIGFNAERGTNLNDENNVNKYTTPQDLRDFGLIPEFVGRFPIITSVNKLEIDDLVTILKEPKNSLVKQYCELLSMDNTNLTFTDGALKEIAELAYKMNTGARGLRSIVETVMTNVMFECADNSRGKKKINVVVSEDMVSKQTNERYKNVMAA